MKITMPLTLLMLVLVSCTKVITPSSAPTISPSATTTLTPSPAPTHSPSAISTLTPTVTLTITPSPISHPTQVYGLLLSPDGTKRIQSPDWNNYQVLTADGKVLWSISYENKLGAFEPGWHPFYWSADGKYVYFTCYHGPDDGSTKFFGNAFNDGDCIYRFGIDNGKLAEVIPEILPGYYAFAISPDGSQLVYTNQTETPVRIKLLNLNKTQERILYTADQEILETGSFGWSPSMDKIVFTTLTMLEGDKRSYSILVLDLKSRESDLLVSNFNERLWFESWDEQGHVYYRDTNRVMWNLNLENNLLTPLAIPTLTLSP